jgi:hypothetical protein
MNSGRASIHMESPRKADHTSILTVVGIALVAYATCDMVHEVLGHGLACLLTGVRATSLSTVALQTGSESRIVAAAGSIANVTVGVLALLWFRRGSSFGPARYFWWLFASINLLNGTGYLLFSGVLDYGDWAAVIAGFPPHSVWRFVMAAVGAALYASSVGLIVGSLLGLIQSGLVDRREVQRLVFPAYFAGGLLFVAGAALNRISPSLILMSGVSSGFGAMAGLAIVPRLVEERTPETASRTVPLGFNLVWVVAGVLVALLFAGLLGPGVRLS